MRFQKHIMNFYVHITRNQKYYVYDLKEFPGYIRDTCNKRTNPCIIESSTIHKQFGSIMSQRRFLNILLCKFLFYTRRDEMKTLFFEK